MLARGGTDGNTPASTPAASNVSSAGGKQVITINAKGGYSPRYTLAKADVPTALKIKTQATFDCSSALTIPSIGYRVNLPPTGETSVDLPVQPAGTILRGQCAMGMYSFSIEFK